VEDNDHFTLIMINANPVDIARHLWLAQGLPVDFLEYLKLNGDSETAINSSFRIGALAQVSPYLLSPSSAITI